MLFKCEYYVSRFGLRRVAVTLCKAFSGVSLQSRFLLVLSMDLLFGWVSIFLCILDILFSVFVYVFSFAVFVLSFRYVAFFFVLGCILHFRGLNFRFFRLPRARRWLHNINIINI